MLLRFSACQLSFADAPVVIPSQFICLDKRQSKYKVTDQDPFSVLDPAKLPGPPMTTKLLRNSVSTNFYLSAASIDVAIYGIYMAYIGMVCYN